MWQAGKEVREPGRKTSITSKMAAPGGLSTLTNASTEGEHASRFMYKSGKEVHEPSRKTSVSSNKGADASKTATSPSSGGSGTLGSGRRRVRIHH